MDLCSHCPGDGVEFGVCYHKDHVSRLMKELGWTPQVPVTRAVQRDEATIRRWRHDRVAGIAAEGTPGAPDLDFRG